jgi:hypothetical protein
MIVNARWRILLGIVLGVTLTVGFSWFLGHVLPGEVPPIVPAVLGLTFVLVAIAVTAFPVVLPLGEPKLCSECGRANVGYYGWESRTCASCVDRIEREIIKGGRSERHEAGSARTQVSDGPDILKQLEKTGSEGSFAALVLQVGGKRKRSVNLQFSIEDGRIGFDWVLLERQNLEDQDRFCETATLLGHRVQALEMNGVEYLRVEDGDLTKLFLAIASTLYGMNREAGLEIITEGFEWNGRRSS